MVELSSLLLPISEEKPCGADSREEGSFNSFYFQAKEERFSARAAERMSDNGDAQPHWQKVYDLCCNILSAQSKDTQVLCWLTEAALRLKGFEGLASTLHLTYILIEKYWDQIYPLPSEDGYEARLSSFYGLNGDEVEGALIFPLLNTPLAHSITVPSFTTWQYKAAKDTERINNPQKKEEKLSQATVTLDEINIAIRETSPDFFKSLWQNLTDCFEALDRLDKILTDKCGDQAPSFRQIRETLQECFAVLKSFFSPSTLGQTSPTLEDPAFEASFMAQGTVSFTREKAFQELKKIAGFFRQSEPHSPLPYILEKAVRWGKMSFQDLLQELVDDEKVLSEIFRLTGMEAQTNE